MSIAEYQRFLLAWQRVDAEHRAEGLEGVGAVLEFLDGYELPAAAWEPELLGLRVKDYTPGWLDQLCFTGRIGWGRLTLPEGPTGRLLAPVRSSPVSLFARENLPHWLALSGAPVLNGIFAGCSANARNLVARRCVVFWGDCQADRLAALASRAGAGRAYRAGLRDRRQLRRPAGAACPGRKTRTVWSRRTAPASQVSHECGVCRTMVLAADAAAHGRSRDASDMAWHGAKRRSRLSRGCCFGAMAWYLDE